MTGCTALRAITSGTAVPLGAYGVIAPVTDKRKAMVEEIMEYVNMYRADYGRRPTQQEIDDFLYTWQRKTDANRKAKTQQ